MLTHLNFTRAILIDFKMPDIFAEPGFAQLNDYFEFHPKAPQMRLKKPLAEFTNEIWELFRKAQLAKLEKTPEKKEYFKFELDIANPPEDQLYPLPIQMFGKLENEAVDRCAMNSRGEFRFAERFGFYLLPGGGMVEINSEDDKGRYFCKMLEEHLEEEQANLWEKAASSYNEHEVPGFRNKLKTIIADKTIDAVLKNELNDILALDLQTNSNADILAAIINKIDIAIQQNKLAKKALESDTSKKEELETVNSQLKTLRALRASVQVETFRGTKLGQEAFDHLLENTELVDIEQIGDTRACGGKQLSHCFILKNKPLEEWFAERFGGKPCQMGDDLTGSKIVHKTLLELLIEFRKVKFSHLLIALATQSICLDDKKLDINMAAIWNPEHFKTACNVIIKEAEGILTKMNGTHRINPNNDAPVIKPNNDVPVKKSTGITKEDFKKIIDAYQSTSFLSRCCGFFNPVRSTAMRQLQKLAKSEQATISKESIEKALGADSKRRLQLFKGEGNSNHTGTDEVIAQLGKSFTA